ncbi:hypothetical protein OBK01_08555 [Empedobacter falsenii]
MKSKNKIIIIIQSIIILVLISFIFIINKENNLRKDFIEYNSKSFDELSQKEYERKNEYLVFEAKQSGKNPDTISYAKAKEDENDWKALENAIAKQNNLEKNNCNEYTLINSFHELMSFNYPYEEYDKHSININTIDNCTIKINVTTRNPKHGWKTFWIFKIYFDSLENQFKMETIKKQFLG